MITAAIYSRKSNLQEGLDEQEKSVARQVEHAKAYAATHGWTVADEHVYSDDGISGVEFEDRPGLQRLLAALKPKPPFRALVMSEPSRLGREQFETGYLLKRIHEAGIEIHYYLSGKKAALGRAIEKLMASVESYSSEQERENISDRTKDGLRRKREQGFADGPAAFGFKNVPVLINGVRQHSLREVVQDEAQVIRRLFALYADDGLSPRRIAHVLNADGCPAPMPRQRCAACREAKRDECEHKVRAWSGPTVRSLLLRPAYREIVGDLTWQRTRERFAGPAPHNPHRLPPASTEARYLLSGLGTCSRCGGPMIVRKTTRTRMFKCGTYHLRGPAACDNRLALPLEIVDRAVLEAVQQDLLSSQAVERVLAGFLGEPEPPIPHADRDRLQADLATADAELTRLAEVAAKIGPDDALLVKITGSRERKAAIERDLRALPSPTSKGKPKAVEIIDFVAAIDEWWASASDGDLRPVLRSLLATKVTFEPGQDAKGAFYKFKAVGTLRPALAGSTETMAVQFRR